MKILTILFFFLLATIGLSQDYKSVSNTKAVKTAIENKHKNTSSIQSDFIETVYSDLYKTPQKGSGKMWYKKSDKIRWENTTNKQIILINGKTVKLKENGKEVSNAVTNKIVKKIQGMMLSMLSGDFLNEQDFSIAYYDNGKNYKLILTPKSPRMSRYVQKIELIFNKQKLLLTEMTMFESQSNKIVYAFQNTVENGKISDSKFNQF